MANQKQDDQLEHSYSSYVMIRDVTPKTYRRWWMIGRRGERGSGISVLAARHDDDDFIVYNMSVLLSIDWYFQIYIFTHLFFTLTLIISSQYLLYRDKEKIHSEIELIIS